MGSVKSLFLLTASLFGLFGVFTIVCCQTFNYDEIRQTFASEMLRQVGNGVNISVQTIEDHFTRHLQSWSSNSSSLSDCLVYNTTAIVKINETCLLQKCLSPTDVYQLSGLAQFATDTDVSTLSMILLHLMENKTCIGGGDIIQVTHERPSRAEGPVHWLLVWGFGILCTTIVSVCSLGGLVALPFVHGINYKKMLIFMVGLAVGTLSGSSLLFLIPEALELTDQELNHHSYVWKCLMMIGGIYTFYIIERILKIITESRERTKRDKKLHHEIHAGTFASFHEAAPGPEYRDLDTLPHVSPCGDSVSDSLSEQSKIDITTKMLEDQSNGKILHNGQSRKHGHSHEHSHVAPVAWMIIFGDGLHNFIDGVSMGAAFTESILAGVSVSVAIMCEEVPHELGDFAVLLNAGMKVKRAVVYNFLSACMCYLGLAVGIFLGENIDAHTWVFAFAGGMFLYISLVDMMPEMNAAGEQEENKRLIGGATIFLLQNLGLLLGFGIMLAMAIYGGDIEATIKGEH